MRRSEPVRIGELWGDFLKGAPTIARKIAEAKISDVWVEVVGASVAAMTTSLEVKTGVLYVRTSSSVVRSELFMRRESLKDSLNRAVGMKVINVVIIK